MEEFLFYFFDKWKKSYKHIVVKFNIIV